MTTPNQNSVPALSNLPAVQDPALPLTGFALTLSLVASGEKLANGLYAELTKDEKQLVRETRLSSAKADSSRLLSGEMVGNGFVCERRELSKLKGGVTKLAIVAYKRPAAPVVKVARTEEETMVQAAAFLGITVEALVALKAAK